MNTRGLLREIRVSSVGLGRLRNRSGIGGLNSGRRLGRFEHRDLQRGAVKSVIRC